MIWEFFWAGCEEDEDNEFLGRGFKDQIVK